jgi:hypothetical protein
MLLSLKNFGFPTWLDKISEILDKCSMSHFFEFSHFSSAEINYLSSNVKSSLQNQFTEKWQTDILKLPKLRTYCLFKSNFEMEKYLLIYNKNHRQALSKLRLSTHSLEIEKGRWRRQMINGKWRNKKIPPEERLCSFCQNEEVESEQHVLMSCTKYTDLRTDPFHTANGNIVNFENLDQESQFIAILQSETSLLKILAKCTYLIFKRRSGHEHLISGHNVVNNGVSLND